MSYSFSPFLIAVLLATSCLAASTTQPATQPVLPSQEEVQKLFDSGDYRGTLQAVSHLLALKGKAADDYDRHELLMLRAEAMLRMKNLTGAQAAFGDAAKGETDDKNRNMALAMQAMCAHISRDGIYTPRRIGGQKLEPMNILNPEMRKPAFEWLYHDEQLQIEPLIKRARSSQTLPPIGEAIKAINSRSLRALEYGAREKDDETKQTMLELRGRAVELITRTMERIARRTDDIGASANEVIRVPLAVRDPATGEVGVVDNFRRRGLSQNEISELKAMSVDATRLGAAATDLSRATNDPDVQDDQVAALVRQSDDIRQKILRAVRTDYSVN